MFRTRAALAVLLLSACTGGPGDGGGPDGGTTPDSGLPACDGTPTACATIWEQHASDRFDAVLTSPADLAAFLKAVPKGGDLHNHLSGAVYAETYLGWGKADGDCINSSTYSSVYASQCSASTQPVPTSGSFFDSILHAWSMKDFVAGSQNGHDHFFATFGKYGAIAGAHRDESIADVLTRAADENQLYVETMFNLGKNLGTLAASTWTQPVTAATLPQFYDALMASPQFAAQLAADVAVVNDAGTRYKTALGCNGVTTPAACDVGVRFIAQISRTGALDTIFGQLVSSYEMAAKTPQIVGANLSSPEDDSTSLANYDLHMAMIDFLHTKYTVSGKSPLHITLHAGEVAPKFLPANSTDNTFHVRHAVETAHAERIGHGVDIASETDPGGLMDEMAATGVAVEVCLSSNDQILEVKGAAHPLAMYLQHGVAVALATDDQGVSRSSLAGEYAKAALDQHLSYRQLKTIARDSLEHSFLPGASLWTKVSPAQPVSACAATDAMGVGGMPNAACQTFLDGSERARMQWELERRFLVFESAQP
jgi:adenosine deaminase